MLTLQKFERLLESQNQFVSEGSGKSYPTKVLQNQLKTAINELHQGNISAEESVKYFPRGQLRDAYRQMLETEWFDVASKKFGYELDSKDFFLTHKPSINNSALPYQGYKLRVSAEPSEAREVAEAVLGPLRNMGEPHKVVENAKKLEGMKGSSQQGKFITVYPEVSEKKVLKHGKQRFTKGSKSDLNEVSVNANYRSTEAVLQNIKRALKQSPVSLKGGTIPPTDVQYQNTRISYRYGIVNPNNGIFLDGSSPSGQLVDVNGNTVNDNRSSRGQDNWRTLSGRKPLK